LLIRGSAFCISGTPRFAHYNERSRRTLDIDGTVFGLSQLEQLVPYGRASSIKNKNLGCGAARVRSNIELARMREVYCRSDMAG
jgi:hypothetical protein